MYEKLSKNGQLYAFLLGLLVIILFLVPVFMGAGSIDGLPKEEKVQTGIFDTGLWLTIILIIAATLAMLLFGVMAIANNLKASMKSLMGFGLLIVLFIVGYFMAKGPAVGSKLAAVVEKFDISMAAQKFINGALFLGVSMIILTAIIFVVSEVKSTLN